MRGQRVAVCEHAPHAVKRIAQALRRGQPVLVDGGDERQRRAGLLEFRRRDLPGQEHAHGKADQRGRNADVLERAAHGILAADRGDAQIQLRLKRAQQRGKRLAPARGVVGHALEILLIRQVRAVVVRARRDQLGKRLDHGEIATPVGVALADEGVEAIGHRRAAGGFAVQHGQLRDHGLRGRLLPRAAEGHEHASRADGRIEAFAEAALRAEIQVATERFQRALAGERRFDRLRGGDKRAGFFGRAVGGEKRARDVRDGLAAPAHHEALFLRHGRHDRAFQIFFVGQRPEARHVLRGERHGHALLRFADGQLRAVQPLVFLGHGVQIDQEAVGQFADGDGYAARAKIVAALDQPRRLGVAQQAL